MDTSLLWDRCAVKKELYDLFHFAMAARFHVHFAMAFVGQLGAVDLAAA